MSVLNENIGIRIKEVQIISWDKANLNAAARPYHALSVRLCGSAIFKTDSAAVLTSKDNVFFFPAEQSFNVNYNDLNTIIVFHFYSEINSGMENFVVNNPHLIVTLFQRAYDIWNEKPDGYYYKTLGIFCEILENISVQQSLTLSTPIKESFDRAIQYMEESYLSYDFSVEKMVSLACMSNTYFRKLFIEKFGVTPSKYITSKRLLHAEKLLSTGRYSVKEVAEKSGFCDVKYFSRVAKKEYGVSPSKLYRHN